MAQPNAAIAAPIAPSPASERAEREKAVRILAKSIFKELKSQGYDSKQIVGLATELIAQVTSDLHAVR